MSINVIDSQIMVTRTTDFSKDTSILQKKNETVQDYMAIQMKAMDEQEQQKVGSAEESEGAKLHAEEDGKSDKGGGERRSMSGRKAEEEGKPEPGTAVPAENHIIDIKV